MERPTEASRHFGNGREDGSKSFSFMKTDLAQMEQERTALRRKSSQMAGRLSLPGRRGGTDREGSSWTSLLLLSMKGVRFKIDITDKGVVGEDGRDEVEFLLSTNPGEPLKPLRKVASGGELSRIMLAVKKITGGDEDKTFVFDEIDAGIGGRVAEVVGRRLRELSGKLRSSASPTCRRSPCTGTTISSWRSIRGQRRPTRP